MSVEKDYISDLRRKDFDTLARKVTENNRPVSWPLFKPEIYKLPLKCKLGTGHLLSSPDKTPRELADPLFLDASRHMTNQVIKAINFCTLWPRSIIMWLQRHVVPLEAAYEFGNRTPALREKMLSLNVDQVAQKLLKRKPTINLTRGANRANCINTRSTT